MSPWVLTGTPATRDIPQVALAPTQVPTIHAEQLSPAKASPDRVDDRAAPHPPCPCRVRSRRQEEIRKFNSSTIIRALTDAPQRGIADPRFILGVGVRARVEQKFCVRYITMPDRYMQRRSLICVKDIYDALSACLKKQLQHEEASSFDRHVNRRVSFQRIEDHLGFIVERDSGLDKRSGDSKSVLHRRPIQQ